MQQDSIILGGVSRVPDDTMSKNGDLTVALNMASDGDGLKMLEKPTPLFQLRTGETILCIHQNDGYKHYISKYDGKLWWGTAPVIVPQVPSVWSPTEMGDSDATQATVMGNTIITQGGTMEYWLWYEDADSTPTQGYRNLGQRPPKVNIKFGLKSTPTIYPGLTSNNTVADPIELWGWWYTEDVPLPHVTTTSNDTKAYRSRMDGDVVPKSRAEEAADANVSPWTDVVNDSANLWDLSLEYAIGQSDDSSVKISEVVNKMTETSLAHINKFIAEKATKENKFVFPFFVRYCYEMYDGSQIMLSDPVLLIPSTHAPQFVIMDNGYYNSSYKQNFSVKMFDEGGDYEKTAVWMKGRIFGVISELMHSVNLPGTSAEYLNWKDLIKSVGIYVSAPIYTYDQAGKVYGWEEVDDSWVGRLSYGNFVAQGTKGEQTFEALFNAVTGADDNSLNPAGAISGAMTYPDISELGYGKQNHFVLKVPEHSNEDIRKAVIECAQFYKLAEIDFEEMIDAATTANKIGDNSLYVDYQALDIDDRTLGILTNKRQLTEEYGGGGIMSAEAQYVYNRRLHMADVSLTLPEPWDSWVRLPDYQITSGTLSPLDTAVDIVGNSNNPGTHAVVNEGALSVSDDIPIAEWLFYPNRGVKGMWIQHDDALEWGFHYTQFAEHPNLNGSYWLNSLLWSDTNSTMPDSVGADWIDNIDEYAYGGIEYYHGEVWTSNPENPFVFESGNVNQVGDGTIKALRAAVAPLAEDQHGYQPMYVFTSQGIWAMTFAKDGTPAAVDHICGDIITDGTEPLNLSQSCLVMTDRGLLELTGRKVNNLSAKIDGEFAAVDMDSYEGVSDSIVGQAWPRDNYVMSNFADPIKGQQVKMSYDYAHQRVYIWLSTAGAWVFNMRTGLWTQTGEICDQAINAYPSCEFVSSGEINTGSSMLAFYGVRSLDTDERYSTGLVTTRPIKLTEAHQKMRQVAVRGFFDPDLHGDSAQVWTVLHGSRNWHDYGLVTSNKGDKVTRLGGSPYRSHILSALLRDNTCTIDRLVLYYDVEQANKIR